VLGWLGISSAFFFFLTLCKSTGSFDDVPGRGFVMCLRFLPFIWLLLQKKDNGLIRDLLLYQSMVPY